MKAFRDRRVSLGTAIKNERVHQGLSQERLAIMVGTSKSQIWRIESGRISTSIDSLSRISEALGIEVSDLMPDSQD